MLTKLLIYTAFILVGISSPCGGVTYNGCPSGMVQVRNMCYKRHDNPILIREAKGFCKKSGGFLAGRNDAYSGRVHDFTEIVKNNKLFHDYLPLEPCYWAWLKTPFEEVPFYNWLSSSGRIVAFQKHWETQSNMAYAHKNNIFLTPLTFFTFAFLVYQILSPYLMLALHATDLKDPVVEMCHVGNTWKARFAKRTKKNYVICEINVSVFKTPIHQSDITRKVAKREKDSSVISATPLFVDIAAVPTMCSRLCLMLPECSVFNYNKVTRECRGFHQREEMPSSHHAEWELWVIS